MMDLFSDPHICGSSRQLLTMQVLHTLPYNDLKLGRSLLERYHTICIAIVRSAVHQSLCRHPPGTSPFRMRSRDIGETSITRKMMPPGPVDESIEMKRANVK
jgi:hypothetical protein